MKDKCCICGKKIKGYGNNAYPLKEGTCCDECNYLVILERIRLMQVLNKPTDPKKEKEA